MATTLMPLDPATTPQRAQRLLPIAAHLLPAEITAARLARRVRARVLVVLAAVAVLLGGWYAFAYIQKVGAQDELDARIGEKAVLEQKQKEYTDVVETQRESKAISARLTTLLADDLRWGDVLTLLGNSAGSTGVRITGLTGSLNSATGPNGGTGSAPAAPSTDMTGTATKPVASITITGTAPDSPTVAQFVDAIGKQQQFANAFITSVTTGTDGAQFNVQVELTRNALGGRFSAKTQGGK